MTCVQNCVAQDSSLLIVLHNKCTTISRESRRGAFPAGLIFPSLAVHSCVYIFFSMDKLVLVHPENLNDLGNPIAIGACACVAFFSDAKKLSNPR